MTLKQRITAALAVLVVILIIGLGIIYQSTISLKATADEQSRQVVQQSTVLQKLRSDVAMVAPALTLLNEVALLKEQLASVQYAFANASLTLQQELLVEANAQFDELAPRLIDFFNEEPSQQAQVQTALEQSKIFANKMNDFFLDDLARLGGDMALGLNEQMSVISELLNDRSSSSVESVNTSVQSVNLSTDAVTTSAQRVQQAVAIIDQEAALVSQTVILAGLILVALCLVIGFTLTNTLRQATEQVKRGLTTITQNKDLSVRINRVQQDELGAIAVDIDSMMDTFETLTRQVKDSAGMVSTEIEQMSKRGQLLNGRIHHQRESVENISAAVTQLSASASEVSNNATESAQESLRANQVGKTGTDVVNSSIQNIENLGVQLADSQQSITQLAADVESIGGILAVIESIAEQTNLLALNAAIEAARAGEQGRGFAVVADEVRSLASRTQQSTVEIRHTIDNLTARKDQVVSAMNASIETSTLSIEQAKSANKAIADISMALNSITDLTQMIANSAREQSEAAAEIANQVVTLSDTTTEISDLSEENNQAGSRMSEQGNHLNRAISVFKV